MALYTQSVCAKAICCIYALHAHFGRYIPWTVGSQFWVNDIKSPSEQLTLLSGFTSTPHFRLPGSRIRTSHSATSKDASSWPLSALSIELTRQFIDSAPDVEVFAPIPSCIARHSSCPIERLCISELVMAVQRVRSSAL